MNEFPEMGLQIKGYMHIHRYGQIALCNACTILSFSSNRREHLFPHSFINSVCQTRLGVCNSGFNGLTQERFISDLVTDRACSSEHRLSNLGWWKHHGPEATPSTTLELLTIVQLRSRTGESL